MSVALAKALLE